MTSRITHPKDFWAGVLFSFVGGAAVVLGRRYPFGTTASMGPGYFPTILGLILLGLGVAATLRGFRRGSDRPESLLGRARPLVAILASVSLFAIALPPLGLVAASMLLVLVSRVASPDFRWFEVLLSGALLTVFCAGVFVWGLGMPVTLWPPFLVK